MEFFSFFSCGLQDFYTICTQFPGLFLSSDSFVHNFTIMLDDAKCPSSGVFLLDIPMMLTFHNAMGKCWALTKRVQNSIQCINIKGKIVKSDVQAFEGPFKCLYKLYL